jgi:hypothetical protein
VLSPHRSYGTRSHAVVLLKWLSMMNWETLLRIISMVVTIKGDKTRKMYILSNR